MAEFKKSWKKFTKKIKKASVSNYKKVQKKENIFSIVLAGIFLVIILLGALSLTDVNED